MASEQHLIQYPAMITAFPSQLPRRGLQDLICPTLADIPASLAAQNATIFQSSGSLDGLAVTEGYVMPQKYSQAHR